MTGKERDPMRFMSVLAAAVLLTGCKKPDAATSVPVVATSKANVQTKQPRLPTAPAEVRAALEQESKQRSSEGLRVETAVEGLAQHGVRLSGVKQVLAATVRARYCVAGQTSSGRSLAVCEYESEAAAREGRAYSLQAFAAARERGLHLRGNLLLTISGGVGAPESSADAQEVVAAFSSLHLASPKEKNASPR